jgi:N-acetylglucosamine kinase-like BadF-type ATPase
VPTDYFLGVDCGRTSTTALIGDVSGRVLGQGLGGQPNPAGGPDGFAQLIRAVTSAVSGACAQAGLPFPETEFASACFGFTGGPGGAGEIVREILRSHRWLITDDLTIALAGAHGAHPGIVTIAGTGSVAFGRNGEGRVAGAGGWGHAFGDEGGAWGIVREALRASFRYQEGWGPHTALHDLFLESGGDSDIHALRMRYYTEEYPQDRVASLARMVDQAAERGDAVAAGILEAASHSLCEITLVVHRRLFGGSEAVALAPIGGVFKSQTLLKHFRREMARHPFFRLVEPRAGPAAGALGEARRLVS